VPPGTLATAFRKEIQNADPDLSVYNLWTLRERLERNYWFFGFIGSLFGGFAVVALLLASVGLYAVIAHSVGRRTQEIGVRMALGASPGHILRMIFGQSLREFFIGLAIGLLGAFYLARFIKTFLVQISPIDPLTFGFSAGILLLAGVLGCFVPARRATTVDPLVALREE
jgi:ABC-type antimicrobial peptide transport system permease subunit